MIQQKIATVCFFIVLFSLLISFPRHLSERGPIESYKDDVKEEERKVLSASQQMKLNEWGPLFLVILSSTAIGFGLVHSGLLGKENPRFKYA